MALFPCDACGQKALGKYANATWAWYRADNERAAYRQHLCAACYAVTVAPLEVAIQSDPFDCPVCHTEPGEAIDPTYLTAYVPGYGKRVLEMATCAGCAVTIRARAQEGATRLENRLLPVGGQDPGLPPDPTASAWAAIGILPMQS